MTIKNFLKESVNYLFDGLDDIDTKEFFKEFGEMNREDMISFIEDPDNFFKVGKFTYQNTYSYWPAYNGKSYYGGAYCTVGAMHSNFAG